MDGFTPLASTSLEAEHQGDDDRDPGRIYD